MCYTDFVSSTFSGIVMIKEMHKLRFKWTEIPPLILLHYSNEKMSSQNKYHQYPINLPFSQRHAKLLSQEDKSQILLIRDECSGAFLFWQLSEQLLKMECVNLVLEITLKRRLRGFFRGIVYTVMYDFIILQRCLGNLTHMKTWYASEL